MEAEVTLEPMTPEMYHTFFREYQYALALYMDKRAYEPYAYEEEKVNRYIQRQIDLNRKPFAILAGGEIVGELII